MKILVCGGRDFGKAQNEYWFIYHTLDQEVKSTDVIIVGDATGTDSVALEWSGERGVKREYYIANWVRDGKAGGPIRNQRMIDEGKPDIVFAFPGGKGTRDMVTRAKKHNIPVKEFHYESVD